MLSLMLAILSINVSSLALHPTSAVRPRPLDSLGNLTEILHNAALKAANSAPRLFVTGGYNGGSRQMVDAFDLPAGSISKVAQLPHQRDSHGAAALFDLLFVVGGDPWSSHSAVDVYIPSPIDAWFTTTPLSVARNELGVCALEGKIYAIGGIDVNALASGEVFDPSTKAWTPIAPMATRRYQHGVGVLHGEIYAVGGNDNGLQYLKSVEKYDPKADRWSPVRAMEVRRAYVAVAVVNNKLYAMGGWDESNSDLKSVEAYDPDLGEWEHVKDMPMRMRLAAAVAFGDLIYVAGGLSNSGAVYLDSVLIFDPEMNVWNTSSSMRLSVPRDRAGAAVLYQS